MTTNEAFWKWVDSERQSRGLSYRYMERLGKVSNGAISGRASDLTTPTYKNCNAIAIAFEIPVHVVLEKAGILSDYETDPYLSELANLAEQLPDDAQRSVLDYVRFLLKPDRTTLPTTIRPANDLEQTILAHLQGMDAEFQETVLKTIRVWRMYEELKRGKNGE